MGFAPVDREWLDRKTDRITVDPSTMNGEACIRGLPITVGQVLHAIAMYRDREELKRAYPDLDDEDIRQVVRYAWLRKFTAERAK